MTVVIKRKHVELCVIIFFAIVISVVFQQIYTSLSEQGIATGGPYNNAAAYPWAIVTLIGALVVVQLLIITFSGESSKIKNNDKTRNSFEASVKIVDLIRPFFLLVIFSIYLGTLQYFGYHLTTTPMVVAIMLLCGMRNYITIFVSAVSISIVLAFLFENFLNVVLPGGIFQLNIPW
tara:strand:+ start:2136 stop:2666 length:531 start_codon:yes stop_codon:yes gene_type:complete